MVGHCFIVSYDQFVVLADLKCILYNLIDIDCEGPMHSSEQREIHWISWDCNFAYCNSSEMHWAGRVHQHHSERC